MASSIDPNRAGFAAVSLMARDLEFPISAEDAEAVSKVAASVSGGPELREKLVEHALTIAYWASESISIKPDYQPKASPIFEALAHNLRALIRSIEVVGETPEYLEQLDYVFRRRATTPNSGSRYFAGQGYGWFEELEDDAREWLAIADETIKEYKGNNKRAATSRKSNIGKPGDVWSRPAVFLLACSWESLHADHGIRDVRETRSKIPQAGLFRKYVATALRSVSFPNLKSKTFGRQIDEVLSGKYHLDARQVMEMTVIAIQQKPG